MGVCVSVCVCVGGGVCECANLHTRLCVCLARELLRKNNIGKSSLLNRNTSSDTRGSGKSSKSSKYISVGTF
jgi:hypothetical protein